MNASEMKDRAHKSAYTAEVNQHYHQIRQRQMWRWDKILKIAVATLALLALTAVFLPHELKWLEVITALVACLFALALNVVPVGEWVTEAGEMFRSWSDLLCSLEQLELKLTNLEDAARVPEHLVEQYADCMSRQCQLDAMEPAPNSKLLGRCQDDVNERNYGMRSYEEIVSAQAAEKNKEEVVTNA